MERLVDTHVTRGGGEERLLCSYGYDLNGNVTALSHKGVDASARVFD